MQERRKNKRHRLEGKIIIKRLDDANGAREANIDISDVKLVSSKYNLSILEDIEYIDINDFLTITDVFDKIDLCGCSMIGGNDIAFDLAVSLGVKYVLIDKDSNINRFFDIVKYLDKY